MLAHLPNASQELAISEHTRWTFITQAGACGTLPYKKKNGAFAMQPCVHGCAGMTASVVQPEDKSCFHMR